MQEELIKVLTLPKCNFKSLSLIHSSLKPDFFHKMQVYLQASSRGSFLSRLKQINLSKNSIEDRSLILFMNLYKEYNVMSNAAALSHSARLTSICLSKCSLTSKSINHTFAALSFPSLAHLDLSYNQLKDEPSVRKRKSPIV